MCGHIEWPGLPTSLAGVFFAWLGFRKSLRSSGLKGLAYAVWLLLPAVTLAKVVADILWLGHDAILG